MPRRPLHTRDSLIDAALQQFWTNGYYATSIEDLVKATGVARHGLYTGFESKHGLFLACFDRYQRLIVDPAFARVEESDATLEHVSAYFEAQIATAEMAGLPGPGCFVANSATEVAPGDADVATCVMAHHDRLRAGFRNALMNTFRDMQTSQLEARGEVMLTFANGLWSLSRVTHCASVLRSSVSEFLSLFEQPRT